MDNNHTFSHCDLDSVTFKYLEKMDVLLFQNEKCIENSFQEFKTKMLKHRTDADAVIKKIEEVKIEINKTDEKIKEDDKKLEALRLKLKKENIRCIAKMKEIGFMEQNAELLDTLIKEKEEDVRKSKAQVERIRKGVKNFTKHLGFHITRTDDGTLIFVFTQIDRKEPEREYILELSLDKDDRYILHRTVPTINNLDFLAEKLNKTNDFLAFLVHIRSLFCKLVA